MIETSWYIIEFIIGVVPMYFFSQLYWEYFDQNRNINFEAAINTDRAGPNDSLNSELLSQEKSELE